MNKFGTILSFEGIDACGKNSQTRKIVEYLNQKGINAELISFPQYNTITGEIIAKYLRGEYGDIDKVPHELICIAFAADRLSMAKHIEENYNNGIWTILDRYTYSNLFTAAKMPEEKWGEFIDWVERMEFDNLHVVEPHYNFYLYIDPLLSIKRIEERGKRDYQKGEKDIHEDNQQLLINTAKCYLQFAESRKTRMGD